MWQALYQQVTALSFLAVISSTASRGAIRGLNGGSASGGFLFLVFKIVFENTCLFFVHVSNDFENTFFPRSLRT